MTLGSGKGVHSVGGNRRRAPARNKKNVKKKVMPPVAESDASLIDEWFFVSPVDNIAYILWQPLVYKPGALPF